MYEHFIGLETQTNILTSLNMLQQNLQQILNLLLLNILNRMVLRVHDNRLDTIRVDSILRGYDGVDHVVEYVTELDVVNLSQHENVVLVGAELVVQV